MKKFIYMVISGNNLPMTVVADSERHARDLVADHHGYEYVKITVIGEAFESTPIGVINYD